MRKLYDEFLSLIDGGAIYERTLKLSALEQHQTTPYHHIVADLVLDELKKAGIPNAERIDIVADGKTAYQDKVMPLAWDATVGRLTMTTTAKNKWVPVSMRGMKIEEDPVIADFERHPFHLVKGSTATPPGLLDRIEAVYQRADRLSLRFAKVYRRILVLLAVLSTLIAASFLLYDEANLHWLILVCGLALLLAWVLTRFAYRSSCHRRYLEYRVLAESLRAQGFLRYAGVRREAITLLPWSQQEETPWIAMAITVLCVGEAPKASHDIRACWPEDQFSYHRKAQKKARTKLRISGRVVGAALLVSIVLYLLALVFEVLYGGLIPRLGAIPEAEAYRTLLKLVLGSISAATLFISNYYGKLSLSRGVEDHVKMAAFYQKILDRLSIYGQDESLLLLLAREELIENGNWCSYQRDNAPDFSL